MDRSDTDDLSEMPPSPPEVASDTSKGVEPDGDSSGNDSWKPADYYAKPPKASRFPRWVVLGCGGASVLILLGMLAIGIFLQSGGLASFIGIAIGQFQGEARNMFEDDVPDEAKKVLDESLRTVRQRITDGEIELSVALPLLQKISTVQKDRKISAEEVTEMDEIIGKILEDASTGKEAPESE